MGRGTADASAECLCVCPVITENKHTRTYTRSHTHTCINYTQMTLKNKKIVFLHNLRLTSSLFTVHVRLAAGRECRDVQLPRNMSPIRYRGRIPVMNGALCGVSVNAMRDDCKYVCTSVCVAIGTPTAFYIKWSTRVVTYCLEYILEAVMFLKLLSKCA